MAVSLSNTPLYIMEIRLIYIVILEKREGITSGLHFVTRNCTISDPSVKAPIRMGGANSTYVVSKIS